MKQTGGMNKRSSIFFALDVYSVASDVCVESYDHEDPIEFIEAVIHNLERDVREMKQKQEGKQDGE